MKGNARRKTLLFILGLLAALQLPQTLLAQQSAGAQCADPSQSLMWQVKSPALAANNTEIYLFGSIHLGKSDFYPLHPRIEKAFRDARFLVLEVDPQAAANSQAAIEMQLRGLLPRGQTLDQVISSDTLTMLEETLQDMGVPLANLLPYRPWMVSLLLTNMQATSLGLNPLDGLEFYFLGNRNSGTRILELESMEAQLSMLENLDAETFLSYTLEDFSRSSEILDTMLQAWRCADKAVLEETVLLSEESMAEVSAEQQALLQEFYDSMFTRRNIVMADGIEALPENGFGPFFVVVGSGHLLGKGSVVDLLQQRGYQVEPVLLD